MQLIETLLILSGICFFGTSLYVLYVKMKKELRFFTWDSYFKQCDIYQGRSFWTTVKDYLLPFFQQVKRKNILKH
ncbi:MAG: hypothetical protein KGY65_08535, partial [Candidatus Thermoplasmatota archaeon]|nr:hypothetical protein [Candidatus Thermoplasmatota archaeon]